MSAGEAKMRCSEIAPLLVFYACKEVDAQERAAIEKHVAECGDCRAQLDQERELYAAIHSLPQAEQPVDPSEILLSQCRSELAESLDDLQRPAQKEKQPRFSWLRGWMLLHPGWSAATLVLLGLAAGVESTQWFARRGDTIAPDQAVMVRPSPQLTEDQLSKMAVAGINFTPSPYPGSQNIRVILNAEQPMELNGNLDDSDVRNVLTYVVKNGERFDSGMRLDCLDALRSRAEDAEVRMALLAAARRDQNPAVRLKALEALRDAGMDSMVREALLDSLKHDSNPGVRVEAVNLLVKSLEEAPNQSVAPVPQLAPPNGGAMMQASANREPVDGSYANIIHALEELQRNDPNRYVRLRSAAALHEISARNDQ